jgi:hypothetical protein
MKGPRLVRYAAGAAIVIAVLIAIAIGAQSLCGLPRLPGDGLWAARRDLIDAMSVLTWQRPAQCLAATGPGAPLLRLASLAPWIMLLGVVAVVAWESLGRRMRLALRRLRGGHAILLGTASRLAELASLHRRQGPVCFLASSGAETDALQRAHPFADVFPVPGKAELPAFLQKIGAAKSRFIAAASEQDYLNVDVMEAVLELETVAARDLLLRLEEAETRAEFAGRFRKQALDRAIALSAVSLSRNQLRDGALAAEPGRFMREGQPQHVAVIGSGPMVQAIAFHIARQGYGLEDHVPTLSIIRTGREDFTSGALERLAAAVDAVTLRPAFADSANAAMLDRAIAAVAGTDVLSAVHCVESDPARTLARAQRFEAMLARMERPVPPIVAYCEGPDRSGETGMIRCVPPGDLSDAFAATQQRDAHAVALHQAYLREQRAARGADFGTAPAEVEWDHLPEPLKDDNRAVADHIAYKLARIGLELRDGPGESVPLTRDQIELLARIEHARWMAAKLVEGWRYGGARDNARMLHPSLVPFDQLSEAEKDKDRTVAMELSHQLAAAGLHAGRISAAGDPRP